MHRETAYMLVINKKNSEEILMIARMKNNKEHVFCLVDEDVSLKYGNTSIYSKDEKEALKSFRARGKSASIVAFSNAAAEILSNEFGISTETYSHLREDYNYAKYDEIKELVSSIEIEVNYIW